MLECTSEWPFALSCVSGAGEVVPRVMPSFRLLRFGPISTCHGRDKRDLTDPINEQFD